MKDKTLNLLIIFLLTFILFNFFNKGQDKSLIPEGLIIKVEKTAYSIPASINILFQNNTLQAIKFNSCESTHILYNGEALTLPQRFCKDYTLAPQEKKTVSLGGIYDLFLKSGQYTFETKIESKKYLSQVEIGNQ